MSRRKKVYFNTSLLLRAANTREKGHEKARGFIEELYRRGYVLVASTLLLEELEHGESKTVVDKILEEYGFIVIDVDIDMYRDLAMNWLLEHGYSQSHLVDVMHMMIARDHGCSYIAAVDRFMWRNAKKFKLKYINYYTGIPE